MKKTPREFVPMRSTAMGVDLGVKALMTPSERTEPVKAKQVYRDLEDKIAAAQRAGKKDRMRALYAKVRNRRQDHLHKLSTTLVKQ